MVDANQKWSVPEAIEWMKELAQFKLHWIEEPTSPDDILGHLGQVFYIEIGWLIWSGWECESGLNNIH